MTRSETRKPTKAIAKCITEDDPKSNKFKTMVGYTQDNEQSSLPSAAEEAAELQRASSEFISSIPAGTRFYSHTTATQRAIKDESRQAENALGNDAFAMRVVQKPLGPFSKYSIEARVEDGFRRAFGTPWSVKEKLGSRNWSIPGFTALAQIQCQLWLQSGGFPN